MARIRATIVGAIALLALLLTSAVAPASVAAPLTVVSASLTQDGQGLVWQVVANRAFSPEALDRAGGSICLLVTQRPAASPVALCLAGPRGKARQPRLIVGASPRARRRRSIPVTVTRSSRQELTASFDPASAGLAYRAVRWQVVSSAGGCGSAGGPGSPSACRSVFPAQAMRLALHTPRVVGCVASGPLWVAHGPVHAREVALTFDDGPFDEPPSSAFVARLAAEHVPATFFEIGDQIARYDRTGAVERTMLAEGDMIGDHTWAHPDMPRLSTAAQRRQILQTAAAIRRATGFEPCLFRAPYGAVSHGLLALARSLGFTTIQWDVDPRDWALPGVRAIERNVIANAHDGAIILQHFGGGPRYETLDALPTEIAALRARGYRFVTVTQMLGYRLLYR